MTPCSQFNLCLPYTSGRPLLITKMSYDYNIAAHKPLLEAYLSF